MKTDTMPVTLLVLLLMVLALVFVGPAVRTAAVGLETVSWPVPQENDEWSFVTDSFTVPNPELLDGEDVMIILQAYDITHADKHGEYEAVRQCMNNPTGRYRVSIKPTKYLDVCVMEGGWGFQPWKKTGNVSGGDDLWQELTAYQKNDVTCFDDLVDYTSRNGYRLFELVEGKWVEIYIGG